MVCLYGAHNDNAVLEGGINFSNAFGTTLVLASLAGNEHKFDSRLSSEKLHVEKLTLPDDGFKTAAKKSKEIGADLLVVSHDKHTQQLVNALEVPVLSILDDFTPGQIRNILMPIHDDPGTRQKIPVATEVAKTFGATINILVVAGHSTEEVNKLKTYAFQAQNWISKKGGNSTYHLETGKKVVDETIKHAENAGADLIVIMNDRDGGGWFGGKPLSEQIMLGSKVPVLIVEPKDTTVSYAGY
jgi:nucleotide-binding universal stress UspA family protein